MGPGKPSSSPRARADDRRPTTDDRFGTPDLFFGYGHRLTMPEASCEYTG